MTRCITYRLLSLELTDCTILANKKDFTTKTQTNPEYLDVNMELAIDSGNSNRLILLIYLTYAKTREQFRNSPYRIEAAALGLLEMNDEGAVEAGAVAHESLFLAATSALGHLNGLIAHTTASFIYGSLFLPTVDADALLKKDWTHGKWENREYQGIMPS
jgi:hypothetical protein